MFLARTGKSKSAIKGYIEALTRAKLDDFMNNDLDSWELVMSGKTQDNSPSTTETVFILYRSGSMSGLEDDTIGGFNSMIDKQKNEGGDALVSTVLFDHVQEVLHNRVKLSDIQPMTRADYWTRGTTALLDAVGRAITNIVNVRRHTRPENIPAHTVFVIITDGYENASTQYSYSDIKRMIEHEKENYGWEVLFIGANIDAVEAASNIGISASRAVNYVADSQGTSTVYEGVSEAMCCMCEERELDDSWSVPSSDVENIQRHEAVSHRQHRGSPHRVG